MKESNQRTLNNLSRERDLGCTIRSIALSHPNIWNFFGSFLKESNQRTFNILSRGRDLGCTLRSIALSHPSIWNFFGSFFLKKVHPVFQQSFQLSTARIPRGVLKKGVFRVFHRKVHRLFKTIHPRFSAAQSGPAEFSTKLTPPTTTTTIV